MAAVVVAARELPGGVGQDQVAVRKVSTPERGRAESADRGGVGVTGQPVERVDDAVPRGAGTLDPRRVGDVVALVEFPVGAEGPPREPRGRSLDPHGRGVPGSGLEVE